MLWALLGMLVPVLIHLFNRARHQVVPFGGMMFVESSLRLRARSLRLHALLLLLVRMAIVALLALAAARPVSRSGGQLGPRPVSWVLVLDTSFSMLQENASGTTPFSQAQAAALIMIAQMASADDMSIVLAGTTPRVLFDEPTYDREALRRALKAAKPSYDSGELPAAISQAYLVLQASKHSRRRVVILTDQQAVNWPQDDARWQQLRRQRATLPVQPAHYILFSKALSAAPNLYVHSLQRRGPISHPALPERFEAIVTNPSSSVVRGTATFSVTGQPAELQNLEFWPGDNTLSFPVTFAAPGPKVCSVKIEGDRFTADNTAHLALKVEETVPVVVVNRNRNLPEAAFVHEALRAADDDERIFTISNIDFVEFEQNLTTILQHAHVLVFTDVPSLRQYTVFALEQFVQQGNGLLVACGPESSPAGLARLYKGGEGLIAIHPTEEYTIPQQATPALVESPIWRRAQMPPEALRTVEVRRCRGGEEAETSQRLAEIADRPLISYQRYGHGSTVTILTPLSAEWSNLPLTAAFVPLLHTLILDLGSSEQPPLNVDQGRSFTYLAQLQTAPKSASVRVQTPDTHYDTKLVQDVDGWHLTHRDTTDPGAYWVRPTDPSLPERAFAARLATGESDFTVLPSKRWGHVSSQLDAAVMAAPQALRDAVAEEEEVQDWWQLFLICALLLLCTELILGERYSS